MHDLPQLSPHGGATVLAAAGLLGELDGTDLAHVARRADPGRVPDHQHGAAARTRTANTRRLLLLVVVAVISIAVTLVAMVLCGATVVRLF